MVVVVMGVSGSGKTAVGSALAARLGWTFEDADDRHPPANVAKMRRGVALSEEDRAPWLASLAGAVAAWSAARRDVVLACSALRRQHRDALRAAAPPDGIRFVYLRAGFDAIEPRLRARVGHFMPASLLRSQLGTLEEPDASEALAVDARRSVPTIVDAIVATL